MGGSIRSVAIEAAGLFFLPEHLVEKGSFLMYDI